MVPSLLRDPWNAEFHGAEAPVFREGEVLRRLGRGPARAPRASVARLLEDEIRWVREELPFRAVTCPLPEGLPGSEFLKVGRPYLAAVVTLGADFDERLAEWIAKGEVARSLVLDAVGSVAVEALADRIEGEVCRELREVGGDPSRRRSPGYGGWELGEQRLLFRVLHPERVGVELGEGCMMRPVKSVSFVVPLFPGEGRPWSEGGRCRGCDMDSCEFREEAAS